MSDPVRNSEEVDQTVLTDCAFASKYMSEAIPARVLPEHGAAADVVYQVIKDMRALDTRPILNLASFVTTIMEKPAVELMMESFDINFVDTEEYPSSTKISNRCVAMLAHLFHAPSVDPVTGKGDAVGTPCVGSSEAIMLCGLAMKKRWSEYRSANGLDISKPNLVMGAETHVCWEKFCRYWDVEARYVPVEEGRWIATPELIKEKCDENTIGVAAVFGTTFTGEFEDVAGIDAAVGELNEKNGWRIVVHVDGASGGMVAPFLYPEIVFDFRLPNVASINVSGHKYGLVYPGLGWAIWRDADYLPESMVFYCNYLGSLERSITLNFSRGASQIIGQYYQFLRLGRSGYTKIMKNLETVAAYIRQRITAMDHFEILSQDVGVPLVAFRIKPIKRSDGSEHRRLYDEFQLAERMRIDGWVLPAYTFPKNAEHVKLMRITIREDFSISMADHVLESLENAINWLDMHFVIPAADVAQLAETALGRNISRLDSKVIRDVAGTILKPC